MSCSRIVSYEIEGPFDEAAMEHLLGLALAAHVVTQFDTGRGGFCWFNGRPASCCAR